MYEFLALREQLGSTPVDADNAMTNRTNHYAENKRLSNTNPTKNRGFT
jgi:hypothetical protein